MIETQDLSKKFGELWAVDGLTLRVGGGQILALLGQNGAGKTTTVRMLTALLSPSRGSARVAGHDVVRAAHDVRACVGVLTEQHGLYARMTGWEYLDFFGRLHGLHPGQRQARIRDLLQYFGIENMAAHRIGEYSKGMKQKLALARALIHEPPILLLDEPTSAMDPESARLVRDEIARLRSEHRTIVLCTHNLAEAETLADIIAIIHKGRILLFGTIGQLRQKVLGRAQYRATFSSMWAADALQLPPGVDIVGRDDRSVSFRVADPQQSNQILVRQLAGMNAPLIAFEEVPRTLEQVYLAAMEQAQSGGRQVLGA
ncbi:MAG: ATP-binding cassette domain-containing protein [Anaerolineales bacterium]